MKRGHKEDDEGIGRKGELVKWETGEAENKTEGEQKNRNKKRRTKDKKE